MDLLIARNPDPESKLPFLIKVPLGDGLVLRTSDTWPRTKALFCYPVPLADWPAHPEVVESIPLRSCARRGGAVDVIADRTREHRSQLVFTKARGRDAVFWQSPRTRKQARPDVRVPTARAGGVTGLEIIIDAHERYPYRFSDQSVVTSKRALACGDYAVTVDGSVVASVERKSIGDLVSSLANGRLRFAIGELAALPRAAVVVEQRYSEVFKQRHIRPAQVADGLAELQVRWPNVPIHFCETRRLAEEWTYRFLAAVQSWAVDEAAAAVRVGADQPDPFTGASSRPAPDPPTAEVRRWAVEAGLAVSDRGRLRPEVWEAWRDARRS